jgi:hypothetical protein
MSASFIVMKNGVSTKITSGGKKINVAHGNPAGDAGVVGKFSTKVRSTGPVSGD